MIWAVILLGLAAGLASGLIGVGGGILFVPALSLFLGLPTVKAEATSLLAIIPVSLLGAYRQQRHGNVDIGAAVALGATSIAGAAIGVGLANILPGRALKILFACFAIVLAAQLLRRTIAAPPNKAGS